ncbi:CPXCG motif-containing cysteine-rich protein [Kushneria indalinina]|uniref:Uncharacterized protein n=1 Tax=Kushneria indalinina DSM 14324 TaxID=1122140 RepID=A0A3D9DUL8_9GAMM|nr:hypothetical protein C8D72_2430 [Kushneria indalinina DSM 14324]
MAGTLHQGTFFNVPLFPDEYSKHTFNITWCRLADIVDKLRGASITVYRLFRSSISRRKPLMHDQWLISWQDHCPYCDAMNDIDIDTSQGSHVTWVDCQWCCAPMVVTVTISPFDDTLESVTLGRDDDA